MCVIMIIQDKLPTDEMVRKAFFANNEGFGIAWRDKDEVVWKKGLLDLQEIKELIASKPLPYIAHFRKQTVGGKRPSLCHPFPIDPKCSDELNGRTRGAVLFHNGTWNDWQGKMWEASFKIPKAKVPTGKWSDTRAMAWLASYVGLGFMEWTYDRAVAFAPLGQLKGGHGLEIISGTGWAEIEGIWCSNDRFMNEHQVHNEHNGVRMYNGYKPWCKETACNQQDNLDSEGYCPKHSKVVGKIPRISPSAARGLQNVDPIEMLAIAEKQQKEGRISKQQLKRIRKFCKNIQRNLAADLASDILEGTVLPPVVIKGELPPSKLN